MKIRKGKIVETKESELFAYYLKRGYDNIYDFPEYLDKMKALGVTVIEEPEDNNAKGEPHMDGEIIKGLEANIKSQEMLKGGKKCKQQ